MFVSERILCRRIDKFFYSDNNGDIKKYSQYCIEKNCKTLASYNYEKNKPRYCNKHKLNEMVNVKRGYRLCKKM